LDIKDPACFVPFTYCIKYGEHNIQEGQMKSEVIEAWPGFFSLEKEWNGLLSNSRADTIFLTWEWMKSWVEVAGKSIIPFIISVRDNKGALVGIAPFYLAELRLLGLVPYHVLRIMADYATGLDYADWIVRKDCEAEVSQSIVKVLSTYSKHWDCIWIPNVAGWTGARERIFLTCKERGFLCHERPRDFGSFDLPEDVNTYMRTLSPKKRAETRLRIRNILGINGVTTSRCRTVDELPRFLNGLFDLHYRHWRQRGEEGTFRRKPVQALFYRIFTKAALEKGWLRLCGLEDHGEFKAVQIGYVYNNIFHSLQEGFDPDYKPGVGHALRYKVIEACIDEKVSSYDFLGEMTAHKKRWGAKKRMGFDFFIGHKSLKNRLLFSRDIWPTGRFLRPVNLPC